MKRLWLIVAFAAALFPLLCGRAAAAPITLTFNDLTGTVTVDLNGSPLPAGGVQTQPGVTVQPQPGENSESVIVVVTGAFLQDGASFTLGLTELPGLQDVSDKITLNPQETGFSVTFASDTVSTSGTETSLGTCAGITCLPEANPDGSGVANPFITRTLSGSIPLTINAFSDSPERPDRVPEPTTLLLLGSSLISLGALSYRRRRGR